MKKEAWMFVLFLAVIFIAGCYHQQEQEGDVIPSSTAEENPFANVDSFVPEAYLKYYNTDTKILEKCSFSQSDECSLLSDKLLAFKTKDYEICRNMWYQNPKNHEECIAPIVAYSAMSLNDKSYCSQYLSDQRLVALCEDDYEKYN